METIEKYLETLFNTMPSTAETVRLREDIAAHIEEKYNELKSGGKTENEAIGIIISEFGSIEEITSEMGISMQPQILTNSKIIGIEEVHNFFAQNKKSSALTAIGVFLCLLGSASLIAISSFNDTPKSGTVSVVVLLVFIAIAVGLFIFADSLISSFSFLEKNKAPFSLTSEAHSFSLATKESSRKLSLIGTIVGIVAILLGVIIFLLFSTSSHNNSSTIGLLILLVIIGLSVATFIITSATTEACDKLLKEGDYSVANKQNSGIIGVVAAIWWPLSTVVFLLWGFLGTNGFGISWVVWPVSGILFGAFAAVISIISNNNNN